MFINITVYYSDNIFMPNLLIPLVSAHKSYSMVDLHLSSSFNAPDPVNLMTSYIPVVFWSV